MRRGKNAGHLRPRAAIPSKEDRGAKGLRIEENVVLLAGWAEGIDRGLTKMAGSLSLSRVLGLLTLAGFGDSGAQQAAETAETSG